MEANVNLCFDVSHTFDDPERYMRLIEKLIYLIVSRLGITFVIGVLSWFMHQRIKVHWSAALRILAYIKSCSGKDLLYIKREHVCILDILIQVMLVTEEI